jgi:DNA gyrase/topoisomerase IV subunit A
MSFNLLPLYYKLLREYDRVLNLTDKLIHSLKSSQGEEAINSLLDERLKSLQIIQKMTQALSGFNPSDSQRADHELLKQLKSLHRRLEEKTSLLQAKEKELEKLTEDLG